MSDLPDPNRVPPTQQRVNPSLESTRVDNERSKALHEDAGAAGAMAGAGLGCLGMAFLPWVAAGLSVLAGIAVACIVRWYYS
jgi:hypothetical protein